MKGVRREEKIYSLAEKEIQHYLQQQAIPYKQEFTFDGLRNEHGTLLPVDFVVNIDDKLAIIEYNGVQHEKRLKRKMNDLKIEKKFNSVVLNDYERKKFSKTTKIPLLVISYQDRKKKIQIVKSFIQHLQSHQPDFQFYGKASFAYFYPKATEPLITTKEVFDTPKKAKTKTAAMNHAPPEAVLSTTLIERILLFIVNIFFKDKLVTQNPIAEQNEMLIEKLAFSTDKLMDSEKENRLLKKQLKAAKAEVQRLETKLSRHTQSEKKQDTLQKELQQLKAKNNVYERELNYLKKEFFDYHGYDLPLVTIGELFPELAQLKEKPLEKYE